MASKNHSRYKLRKKMNAIKHEPKRLFDEPPKLIKDWEDLVGMENEKYRIEVKLDGGCGHVYPKFEVPDSEYYDHFVYLHTHTFYGLNYYESTATLRRFGFNVQLENWDGETIYCRN